MEKSIKKVLEEVCEDICNNYCRFRKGDSCPLDRLN